jgi:hypothetical protein
MVSFTKRKPLSEVRDGDRPAKVEGQKVMHEHKHGTLKSSSGRKVKSRKQAVAMSKSGQSRKKAD